MPMNVTFYHGWGFESGIWAGVIDLLPDWQCGHVDRGYFEKARKPDHDAPCLAVTHSFGAMLALRDPPPHCVGIVAVNGFDRFVARGNAPGVHPRILKRMIARFEEDPETVLREFRQRCGCEDTFPAFDKLLLGEDLRNLATMDCSARSAEEGLPVLSLQGATDPILLPTMRESVFAKACRIERRTIPTGGHLLPLTEPEACARAIREFAQVLV